MDSEAACRAVEHGVLELAIVTLPDPRHSTLELLPLWEDTLNLVTATDHPLSEKKRITLADLCQYPAILPAHGTFTRELIEQRFAMQARNLHVVLEDQLSGNDQDDGVDRSGLEFFAGDHARPELARTAQ